MRIKIHQLELRPCADAFNLIGERGRDGAAEIAELARAASVAREAREWQERMQRKLSECPGFVGCHPPGVESRGTVTVQPGAADDAVEFLRRRFHVGQVGWQKGLGMIIEVLPRRKGQTRASISRRFAPIEQFHFTFQNGL
jgi:hypothetical protein